VSLVLVVAGCANVSRGSVKQSQIQAHSSELAELNSLGDKSADEKTCSSYRNDPRRKVAMLEYYDCLSRSALGRKSRSDDIGSLTSFDDIRLESERISAMALRDAADDARKERELHYPLHL
jgi:hypothetical protein